MKFVFGSYPEIHFIAVVGAHVSLQFDFISIHHIIIQFTQNLIQELLELDEVCGSMCADERVSFFSIFLKETL